MVTTALRYCVLSLLCHVGFAQEAKQETCLSVMPDEIRLDFTDATLRSNNLGGLGPGPELCEVGSGEVVDEKCGFYDLNHTHPYYDKMVFGNVTNRETAERLGGLVDLVITAVTPYEPHVSSAAPFTMRSAAPFTMPSTPQPMRKSLVPLLALVCVRRRRSGTGSLAARNSARST